MSALNVFDAYENIRRKNEAEARHRRDEVYRKVPIIKTLHERIRLLQLERMTTIAQGGNFNIETLASLRQEAERALTNAGYDAHYLDPIYTCPVCRDTGLRDDAHRCECFLRYRLEYKLDEARFTDDDVSFENFDLSHFSDKPILNGPSQRELMAQYKRITQAWADKFPDCSQMVLISGGTGLGKTYTVRCIMRRVIERGFSAAYFTAYRLFSLFHSHRLGESVDLEPIFAVPLLIIDDLGTEPMTRNVTKEYLFDLINERAAANLHTIIVTNLTFDSVNERYGERIHSRLMYARHTKIIQYQGDDIRLSKQ